MTIDKNNVILTNEEYTALINEFNALQHKYDNICDNYRLCKDANESIKQRCVILIKENEQLRLENNDVEAQVANARKEQTKEVFSTVITYPVFSFSAKTLEYMEGYMQAIDDYRKQIKKIAEEEYGVEDIDYIKGERQ